MADFSLKTDSIDPAVLITAAKEALSRATEINNFALKVDPEVLISAANEISSRVTEIKNALSAVDSEISQIPTYWTGEAADAHIGELRELVPKFEEAVNNYNSDVYRLREISGNIIDAGGKAEVLIEGLPNNAI